MTLDPPPARGGFSPGRLTDPWRGQLLRWAALWCAALLVLGAVAVPFLGARPESVISDFYLLHQDLVVLGCMTLAFVLAFFPSMRLAPATARRLAEFADRRGGAACLILAGLVGLAALLGW